MAAVDSCSRVISSTWIIVLLFLIISPDVASSAPTGDVLPAFINHLKTCELNLTGTGSNDSPFMANGVRLAKDTFEMKFTEGSYICYEEDGVIEKNPRKCRGGTINFHFYSHYILLTDFSA